MKRGTRVTAPAAATVLGGAGTAAAAPVHAEYTVTGSTHIAKPDADFELGPGQFAVDLGRVRRGPGRPARIGLHDRRLRELWFGDAADQRVRAG
ncbi:hypothetical protein AB0L41_17450 [Amycolatopsis mediterranei]|uniref:hypothetical protein n=1 Tax=Amycolatopsis mediterranei TaxID=33910 RepID=UPI003425A06E